MRARNAATSAFSILERIDVGETLQALVRSVLNQPAFSILERIDVGETDPSWGIGVYQPAFQYPRTDRRG